MSSASSTLSGIFGAPDPDDEYSDDDM